MNPRKVLWFGQPKPGSELHLMHLGPDYYLEHLSLPFKSDFIEYLGKYAAGVICYSPGEEYCFRLLRQLRSGNPQTPLIVLAENPSKSELLEAFRSGATDCVEEPIDSEGFFTHLKRHIQAPKVNTIQALLQELGKKIAETVNGSYHMGIVPSSFIPGTGGTARRREAINISFFGQFRISINGKSPDGDLTFREKSLLAYLAFHNGKAIHRDRLTDRFWADSSAESAKNSMHVAIAGIRRYLESACPDYSYITCQKQMYSFNPAVGISTDAGSFLNQFQEALSWERNRNTEQALHAYHRAFAYYRDEFLTDLEGADWVQDERDRLREKYIVVMKTLGEYFGRYEQHELAIGLFNKILEEDDCYELAHRLLMESYLAKGMKDQAIRQFQKCREVLWRKLEIRPSSETLRLLEFITKGK